MRLIDLDTLIAFIKANGMIYANTLDNFPTVEAVPVVQGEWKKTSDYVTTAYGSLDIYKCSVCGADVTIDEHDSYCPSCGARMDGDTP